MNPCLDCKIFMVNKAKQWADENGFDFIITGEVVGQRPMSQRKDTMPIISHQSGADDRLLRPLCARNLPPTLPETEGWVTRDELYGFSGRNRKPQMELAKQFGFDDYAKPAGGCCFLTDENYSAKLVDLWDARGNREYEMDDIMLLKVGRHIRPAPTYKLIIGREDGENKFLQGYKNSYISFRTVDCPGPLTLLDGVATDNDLEFAARLVARFSKDKNADKVTIEARRTNGDTTTLNVQPLTAADIKPEWYV